MIAADADAYSPGFWSRYAQEQSFAPDKVAYSNILFKYLSYELQIVL